MTIAISGTTGITLDGQFNSASSMGFKNRIINGAMVIDQRNAGASVTPANAAYTLDRWQAFQSVASKYSVQQNAGSVTPPAGFTNYLGVTSLSAYSVASGDYFALNQSIEGFNVADFGFGTASASTVILSFLVRSSLTGTFGGALKNSAGAGVFAAHQCELVLHQRMGDNGHPVASCCGFCCGVRVHGVSLPGKGFGRVSIIFWPPFGHAAGEK